MQRVYDIVDGLNRKYPDGNDDAFRCLARLTEEVGELAEQINHFRGNGSKAKKLGEPNVDALAGEIRDVVVAAMAIARSMGVELEVEAAINSRIARLTEQGHLEATC